MQADQHRSAAAVLRDVEQDLDKKRHKKAPFDTKYTGFCLSMYEHHQAPLEDPTKRLHKGVANKTQAAAAGIADQRSDMDLAAAQIQARVELIKAMKQVLMKQSSAAVKNIGRLDQKPSYARPESNIAGARAGDAPQKLSSDKLTGGGNPDCDSAASLRDRKACDALAAKMLTEESAVDVQLQLYLKAYDNHSLIEPLAQASLMFSSRALASSIMLDPTTCCRVHSSEAFWVPDIDLWLHHLTSSSPSSVTNVKDMSRSRSSCNAFIQQDKPNPHDQSQQILVSGAVSYTVDVSSALAEMHQQGVTEVDVLMEDAEDSELDICQVELPHYLMAAISHQPMRARPAGQISSVPTQPFIQHPPDTNSREKVLIINSQQQPKVVTTEAVPQCIAGACVHPAASPATPFGRHMGTVEKGSAHRPYTDATSCVLHSGEAEGADYLENVTAPSDHDWLRSEQADAVQHVSPLTSPEAQEDAYLPQGTVPPLFHVFQVGDSVAMTDMDVAAELVQLVWDEDEAAPATRLQPPITLQNMAAAEAQTAGSEKSPPSFSRQSAVISGELLADAAADPCDVNMCDRFDLDDGEVVCPEVALEEAVCIVFDDDADIPVLYEDEQLSSDQKRAGPRPVAAAQQQQLFAPKPTCGSHISTAVTPEAVGAVASAPVTIQLTPALRRPALVRRRQMYQMVADAAETDQVAAQNPQAELPHGLQTSVHPSAQKKYFKPVLKKGAARQPTSLNLRSALPSETANTYRKGSIFPSSTPSLSIFPPKSIDSADDIEDSHEVEGAHGIKEMDRQPEQQQKPGGVTHGDVCLDSIELARGPAVVPVMARHRRAVVHVTRATMGLHVQAGEQVHDVDNNSLCEFSFVQEMPAGGRVPAHKGSQQQPRVDIAANADTKTGSVDHAILAASVAVALAAAAASNTEHMLCSEDESGNDGERDGSDSICSSDSDEGFCVQDKQGILSKQLKDGAAAKQSSKTGLDLVGESVRPHVAPDFSSAALSRLTPHSLMEAAQLENGKRLRYKPVHNPETLLNPLHPLPPPPSEAPIPQPIASIAMAFMAAILGDEAVARIPLWPPVQHPPPPPRQRQQQQQQQPLPPRLPLPPLPLPQLSLLLPQQASVEEDDEYDDAFWAELDAVVESGRSDLPSSAPLIPTAVQQHRIDTCTESARAAQAQTTSVTGTATRDPTQIQSVKQTRPQSLVRIPTPAAEILHPHMFTVGRIAVFTALDQYVDASMHSGDGFETIPTTEATPATAATSATAATEATAECLSRSSAYGQGNDQAAAVQGECRANMGALAQETSAYDTLLTELVASPHQISRATTSIPSIYPSHPVPVTMGQQPTVTFSGPETHLGQQLNAFIINPAEDAEEDAGLVISVCVEPDEELFPFSAPSLVHRNSSKRKLPSWMTPSHCSAASCHRALPPPVRNHKLRAMAIKCAHDSSRGPHQDVAGRYLKSEPDLLLLIPQDDDTSPIPTSLAPSKHQYYKETLKVAVGAPGGTLDHPSEPTAAERRSLLMGSNEREVDVEPVCCGGDLCSDDTMQCNADVAAADDVGAYEEGCIIFFPEDDDQEMVGGCEDCTVLAYDYDAIPRTGGHSEPCSNHISYSSDVSTMLDGVGGSNDAEGCPVFCPEDDDEADDAALAEWGRTLMGLSQEAVAAMAHKTLSEVAGVDNALSRAAAALVQSTLDPQLDLELHQSLGADLDPEHPEMYSSQLHPQQLPCMNSEKTGMQTFESRGAGVGPCSQDLREGLLTAVHSTGRLELVTAGSTHAARKGPNAKEQLHMKFIQEILRVKCKGRLNLKLLLTAMVSTIKQMLRGRRNGMALLCSSRNKQPSDTHLQALPIHSNLTNPPEEHTNVFASLNPQQLGAVHTNCDADAGNNARQHVLIPCGPQGFSDELHGHTDCCSTYCAGTGDKGGLFFCESLDSLRSAMCADAPNTSTLSGCNTTSQRVFFVMLNLANQTNTKQASQQTMEHLLLHGSAAACTSNGPTLLQPVDVTCDIAAGSSSSSIIQAALPGASGSDPAALSNISLDVQVKLLRDGIVASLRSTGSGSAASVLLELYT